MRKPSLPRSLYSVAESADSDLEDDLVSDVWTVVALPAGQRRILL